MVLDMGCGAGVAVNALADTFPASTIHGIDPDSFAIQSAQEDAAAQGLTNCAFFVAKGEGLTGSVKYSTVAYSIQHTAYSIQHTPYTIHRTPYTIHHTPYAIH
jgi:trans-aconitate methyltransferase